jgi:hypothetical protein
MIYLRLKGKGRLWAALPTKHRYETHIEMERGGAGCNGAAIAAWVQ